MIALPYSFDTTGLSKVIVKFAFILLLVLFCGLIKFIILKQIIAALGVLGICLLVAAFAFYIFKKSGGSSGTLTREEIIVKPNKLFGFKSSEPEGRFPLTQFDSIRIEWIPRISEPEVLMTSGINEHIFLRGKNDVPNILIASLTNGEGVALGQQLGELLGLPTENIPGPGVHPAP